MTASVHRIYRPGDRDGFMVVGSVFMLIGGLFVLGGFLSAVGVLTKDREAAVVGGLPIGALMFFVGWKVVIRRPHTLFLMNDGTLHAQRVVGQTIIRVAEIRSIEMDHAKIGIDEDNDRQYRIFHARGSFVVDDFPEVDDFLAEVRAMNPRVTVRYWW